MLDSKNTNFASVFIYFRETQTAIGAFGVASKNSLYDMLLKEEFDNSDNMDRFFKNNYVDTFDDINSNSKNSSGRYLCYCKSIPLESADKEKGATIVVLLSNEFFYNTLENSIFGKDLYLTLLSKNGDILFANSNISDKIIEYCTEQQIDSEQHLNLEYDDMMLSVIKENITKVVYLLALPKRVFWKETIVINIYIVLTVLFAMVLGALAIYVFSKYNYSPLKKLMMTVSSRTNENFNNLCENEYLYLHNTIEKTLNKNDSLEKSIDVQKRSLNNLTLYKVLNGDVNEYHELRSIMMSYFENCEQSSMMVLYVTIDSLGVFGENDKDNYGNSQCIS